MQSWGYYERTDIRDGDGSRFEPIPIQRFYCRKCKRTFSVLPAGWRQLFSPLDDN